MKLALELNFDPTTQSFKAKGKELRPAYGKTPEQAVRSLVSDEKNRLILRARSIKEVLEREAPIAGRELAPFNRADSKAFNIDKAVMTGRPTRANIALGHIAYLRMGLAGLTHSEIAEKLKLGNRQANIAKRAWDKASRWAVVNKKMPEILLMLQDPTLVDLRRNSVEVTKVLDAYEKMLRHQQQNPLELLKMAVQGTSYYELAKMNGYTVVRISHVVIEMWRRAVEYAKSVKIISSEFYGMERLVDIQASVLIAMKVIEAYEKFIIIEQARAQAK